MGLPVPPMPRPDRFGNVPNFQTMPFPGNNRILGVGSMVEAAMAHVIDYQPAATECVGCGAVHEPRAHVCSYCRRPK